MSLVNRLFPEDKVNHIIDNFAISAGKMLVIIIPFIFRTKDKIIKKDEICTKKNIKYQAILWAINLVLYPVIGLVSFGGSDSSVISFHNSLLVTREAIEIIILSFKIINYLKR